MSSQLDAPRRVSRLLRWYPREWRDAYGDEFAYHLEQEFEDRPVDGRRAVNVACMGLVARMGDIGLSSVDVRPERHIRVAVSTSFVLSAMAAVFALSFWGRAMIQWNASSKPSPSILDSLATGALTAATGLLIVVLVVTVLSIAALVVRQAFRRRIRPLAKPVFLALTSGALLLYVFGFFSTLLGELRAVPWAHPGLALKALGELGLALTNRLSDLHNRWINGSSFGRSSVNVLAPLATAVLVAVFAVAIASLLRRVEMSHRTERLGALVVTLLGTLTATFFVSCLAWIIVGGSFENRNFALPLSHLSGGIDLAVLALFTASVGLLGMRISSDGDAARTTIVVDGNQ